jgi:hypothetical protein
MTAVTLSELSISGYPRFNVGLFVVLAIWYSPDDSVPLAMAFLKYLRSDIDTGSFNGTAEAQTSPDVFAIKMFEY